MDLIEIKPEDLVEKPFKIFTGSGVLLTAGSLQNYNMMTIGWGTLGTLWGKSVAIVYIRPSRYTYEFMENHPTFSLSVFSPDYRKILSVCGTKSGRQINKMELEGLTPVELDQTVIFKEADLVLTAEKIYFHDIKPERIPEKSKSVYYSSGDFHRVYYGEILHCYKKN